MPLEADYNSVLMDNIDLYFVNLSGILYKIVFQATRISHPLFRIIYKANKSATIRMLLIVRNIN